jgi:hypothetical protein
VEVAALLSHPDADLTPAEDTEQPVDAVAILRFYGVRTKCVVAWVSRSEASSKPPALRAAMQSAPQHVVRSAGAATALLGRVGAPSAARVRRRR